MKMGYRLWALCAALAVVAGLVGCGSSSPSEQVRAAYSRALSALGHGDYGTFCGLLSDAYRAKLLAAAGGAGISVSSCAKLFGQAVSSGSVSRAQLKATANQPIEAVRVSGQTARITVAKRVGHVTITGEATAALENGEWRIDSFPTKANAGNDIVYRVPSGSMEPTLHIGQQVLVDPASYRTGHPAIGDIVVFHPPAGADLQSATCGNPNQGAGHQQACGTPTPEESTQTFIKRLVAGPGDTVEIRDGRIYRNGVPEKEPYIEQCGGDPSCTFLTPVSIPPGDYFVLGDNRGASDDSRFGGPVRLQRILGKVVGSAS